MDMTKYKDGRIYFRKDNPLFDIIQMIRADSFVRPSAWRIARLSSYKGN